MTRYMGLRLAITMTAILLTDAASGQTDGPTSAETSTRIRIVLESTTLSGYLEDTRAGQEFAALLPLEITLEDYHGIEKVADLPSSLPTAGAPAGIDPEIGDITYYAPWGNLALFYRDFRYSKGLLRLGRVEEGVDVLAAADEPIEARIELVNGPE